MLLRGLRYFMYYIFIFLTFFFFNFLCYVRNFILINQISILFILVCFRVILIRLSLDIVVCIDSVTVIQSSKYM